MQLQALTKNWEKQLNQLARSAQHDLVVVSPFLTLGAVRQVVASLSPTVRLVILTDLSPRILTQATDPAAIASVIERSNTVVLHLRGIHAKVYIADDHAAIVTSGNLTQGGLTTNHEFGLLIQGEDEVSSIRSAVEEYVKLGTIVDQTQLRSYLVVIQALTPPVKATPFASDVIEAYRRLLPGKRDRPQRIRAGRGTALRGIFAPSIASEISLRGPQSVEHLYEVVRGQYPDLCDDLVTRGKPPRPLWKHEVRFALEELKADGILARQAADGSKSGKWARRP